MLLIETINLHIIITNYYYYYYFYLLLLLLLQHYLHLVGKDGSTLN